MKPICLICARGGSKGVPNKNIRIISKKPLIAHTITSAINSKLFSHVVVSTENKNIAQISKKYGAEVPFIRPKNLALDTTPVGDVFIHAIKKLYSLGYEFEIFVNRDCTVPFIKNTDIKKTIDLLKNKKCDAVYGVYRQHLNPYFNMMEKNKEGYLRLSKKLKKRPKSRQKAPIVFQLNGLFTFDAKKFLNQGDPIMANALPYEISPESGLMIDTEIEFKMAEVLFKLIY
ncbi:MAG: acylneuraminate cytidylyltransferase [Thaumarchaeota archaeon]|jgi:CMP-N-acetylneuraminic acid synthetase|nr:MAG: acylneuraminate cytidylyltransferase [Nitrososphaerota archaeon]